MELASVGNRYYSLNVRISRFSYFLFSVRRMLLDQVSASPQNENSCRIVDATLDHSFGRPRDRSQIPADSDSPFLGFSFPELRYVRRTATPKILRGCTYPSQTRQFYASAKVPVLHTRLFRKYSLVHTLYIRDREWWSVPYIFPTHA